jgi:hypothetical protein
MRNIDSTEKTLVFTPDNEPYGGRNLLYHFDQLICSMMEQNSDIAPKTHGRTLNDHQKMACLVISQSISITLSIRELIRQGYLFSAHVLVRAVVERAVMLLYLQIHPEKIESWNNGWHQKDNAPNLAKMLEAIQRQDHAHTLISGRDLTASMNSLLHGKPDSAPWNLVLVGENGFGHAVSKILNRPDLCDDLCADLMPWVVVVLSMVAAYFPDEPVAA